MKVFSFSIKTSCILGETIKESIESILKNGDEKETFKLSHNLTYFIEKIQKYKLKTWSKMLQLQLESVKSNIITATETSSPKKPSQHENSIVFTPALDEYKFGKIKCPVCETLFKHKRSYETHHLRFHHDHQIDDTLTDPKGKCRLISKITKRTCGKEFSYRGIYRHIKNKHSIERPSVLHKLVAFDVTNSPKPIFVKEGRKLEKWIKKFKNSQIVEEIVNDLTESDNVLTPEKRDQRNEEIVELNSSFSSPISRKCEIKRKRLCNVSPKIKISFHDDDDDNMKYEDEINDLHVNDCVIPKKEIKLENNTIKNENFIQFNSPLSTVSQVHLDVSMSDDEYCTANLDEQLQVPRVKDETSNLGSISDKFNESFGEGDLIDSVQAEKSNNYNSVESLCLEIDSDYSDGDTEEFTMKRLKNKNLRQKERDKNSIKNHQVPENFNFISSMKEYLKNETIATVNLDNSSINKTLSHLFYQDDCFLNFQMKQDENFNLGKLTKFNCKSFQMLKFPLDWLTQTVKNDGIKESFL